MAAEDFNHQIWVSTNSGNTWALSPGAPINSAGLLTWSRDGSTLLSGDFGGYLYISKDSGQSWMVLASASHHTWYASAISANGLTIAALTNYGAVFVSRDGGNTFSQSQLTQTPEPSLSMSSDGNVIVLENANSNFYRSTNGGQTWTSLSTATGIGQEFVGMVLSSNGQKMFSVGECAQQGYGNYCIFSSNSQGANWNLVSTAGPNHQFSLISASSDLTQLAVGDHSSSPGYINTSNNSASSWHAETAAGTGDWYGLASSADGTKLIAAGGVNSPGLIIGTKINAN